MKHLRQLIVDLKTWALFKSVFTEIEFVKPEMKEILDFKLQIEM